MSDEMSDFDRAQIAYLQQRTAELKSDFEQSLPALGEAFGVENLAPEDFTFELYELMIKKVIEYVRDSGNPALADRYQGAHADALQAMKVQGQFFVSRMAREERWTDVECAHADALQAMADDANEQFERVQAETSAYLRGLDEKGGA